MKKFLFLLIVFFSVIRLCGQTIQASGPLSFCTGGNVALSVSTAGTFTYQWRKDGANISAATAATYTANTTGSYSVIITSGAKKDTLKPVAVAVSAFPLVPVFTFDPNTQCSNKPVAFSITNKETDVSYTWDFGDAAGGTGTNVSHAYNAFGSGTQNFSAAVKATRAPGCSTTSIIQTVTVNQIPDPRLLDVKFRQFNNCGNNTGSPIYKVDVLNTTSNAAAISGYTLNWGEGGNINLTNATFSTGDTISHTYNNYGVYNLAFTATNSGNGCTSTKSYSVINQLNPGVGIEGPPNGSTQRCDSAGFWFKVKNYSANSPDTKYIWDFGDGSSTVTWTSPLIIDSIYHLFSKSSCELPGHEFVVSVTAQNSCDATSAKIDNIKIFKRPKADFDVDPVPGCTNKTINFTNTSIAAFNGSDCNRLTNYQWNFGDPSSGSQNTSALKDPTHAFATAGIYNVNLIATGDCGADTITKTVCITAPPSPDFILSNASGCFPLTVTATNTTNTFNSCQNPTYSWTVSYTPAFCGTASNWDFAAGSSDTSTNPGFVFSNPGTYTITLAVTNACGTFPVSHTVDVKKPPTAVITPPSYPCGPVTITPAAVITACGTGTLAYAWAFAGGVPATSTLANPSPVSFSGIGLHAITLTVTNECGSVNATESVTVTAAPDVVVPASQNKCGGELTGPLNFSSTVGTPVYNWTNSNPLIGLPAAGTGNIAPFNVVNSGTVPVIATIIVTPFVSDQCSGKPDTFTITVNPRPARPFGTTPVVYCLNAITRPLLATGAAGDTLHWFNNPELTGGTTTAPTPSASAAGTTLYYLDQTNSFGCASDTDIITVTINPSIAGNVVADAQNICFKTIPAPLTTANTVSGGSGAYDYLWQFSINGGLNWLTISGANGESYSPPALLTTTKYRRVVGSGTCSDTSSIITITVQGALTNYAISAAQTICEGATPDSLIGEIPIGGGGSYIYTWESSADNISWLPAGATTPDYQPPALLQTTYFRRKVDASQCAAVSPVVIITVNPKPNGHIDAVSNSLCEYETAGVVFNADSGTAPFNILLSVTLNGGAATTIAQTINNNGPATINAIPANSTPGIYTITLTKITDSKLCERTGNLSSVTITLKPKPLLITSAPPTVCSGNSALLTVSGADDYTWAPQADLSSATGDTVTASPANTTTYVVTGTRNGCLNKASLAVTVTPGTTVASAGAAQVLCDITSATLNANAAVTGTGSWRQTSGPAAVITDATKNNSTVTGLTRGRRYVFTWTITGLPPCPATSANDTIDVLSPIINAIKNDTVICSAQPVLLQTLHLSGGNTDGLNAGYSYQWEEASPAQNNWQPIPGATADTLAVSPVTSTCYRRKVKSNNACDTVSNTVCLTVNPGIGNNVISAAPQVCVNVLPGNITGTQPTGGDNKYIYQWQTGTDGINWTDIDNNINYQPGFYPLAGIHYFRRNVASGNCISASNTITIAIRPDSKAIFGASPVTACAPFDLSTAITVTPLPDSNGLYLWYADGVSIGSNSTGIFPGYTLQHPADTATIKLKTTSPYGCKADSIEQQFITVITAQAKFSKDTGFGCGPLPVIFVNTSSLLNGIQFFWDFGNGAKSTAAQPGTINFNSSPFFNDTTYQVSLKAYNGCDTTTWTDSVKVRANSKARFGVDTTFGCSPFTVLISNTSGGGPNRYYWDFGNGTKDTTFTNGIFSYKYNVGNKVDTFTIRLISENQCSRDTESINIRVAPNPIRPLINVNSSQLFGCAPHIVSFNNNTSGATGYTWNFGDNTLPVTTNNNDSDVVHRYDSAGVFTVAVDITNGCSDTTVFRQVTVYPAPKASFSANAIDYCAGDTVKVINSSVNATNFEWFWGDGSTGSGVNPVHVYTTAGNYNILLQALRSNSSGIVCMDTLVRPVTVFAKPVVTVQSNIQAINCAPFTLAATATGITNEKITWYFYDSTATPSIITSANIAAQYIFTKPGSFYVKLVAVNAHGCTDSMTIPFTVRGKAVASVTPSAIAVCIRDTTVSYLNTSTYDGIEAISYRWLVDNVLISTGANFTHRYNVLPGAVLPKIFNTLLIVSNTAGCSDTATATLQMNPPAKAQFSIANAGLCVPFQPVITNTSSYTTDYHWLLNGNTVSNDIDPAIVITQGAAPYTISLVADNVYGCKPDTFSVSFTSRARPAASFRLSDTLGCTGVLNVGTANLTTGASSYIWNWGDVTANSFFTAPTHLYTTPGQYLITLVASDGVCTDTTQQLVKVSTKPVADFSVDQTVTCDTARVQFINLTTNGSGYTWSFGDGTFSNAVNPAKSFAPSNVPYTVKLVAASSFGCKDSAVKANLVLAKVPPASDFFISPSPVITVPDYTFSYNNLTLNSAAYKYLWSLGDGSFAETRDVTHKYADTGNYLIRLIVLDTVSNCPDTTIKIARVDGFPGYLYVPNAICPACIQTNLREFLPKGAGLKEYRLQIFTTWNELIFETRAIDSKGSPTQAWDGKFKGTVVEQDVYVWRIDAKFLNGSEWTGMIYPGGSTHKKAGTITVIK